MNQVLTENIHRLEKAFDAIERETPFLKPVTQAFREVVIGKEIVKSRISPACSVSSSVPKEAALTDGCPFLTEKTVASFVDSSEDGVKETLRCLQKAFPSIRSEIGLLMKAIEAGMIDIKGCICELLVDRQDSIVKASGQLGVNPVALNFLLLQALKPFVEKRAEELEPMIRELPWHQGYCPVCGAFPELSFLQGEEGQRWLRCSLCAFDWRFDRMGCPYCGEKNSNKEFIYIEDSRSKWVELCSDCRRYIVGIDLRDQPGACRDVAAIGMVHLDMIAQQKGFQPVAECAWNVIPPNN